MDRKKRNNPEEKIDQDDIEKVRSLSRTNKAAALGFAVFLTASTMLSGCGQRETYIDSALHQPYTDEEDEYYYYSGGGYSGGYYFNVGSTYDGSTWRKSTSGISSSSGTSGYKGSSYSSIRGGSVGS